MDDGYVEETCGYLWVKQPPKNRKRKLKKAWKRKWVLLQHSGDRTSPTARLRIFSDKDSYSKTKKCELVIPIGEDLRVRRSKSSSQSYAFVVREDEPRIFLAGGSETDVQSWMRAMRNFTLGEPYDLENLYDRFVVYIIDNESSERLGLSGGYYLSIARTSLTLSSVTEPQVIFSWTTSSLKRFELVSVKCAQDKNKILRIIASKESESGEGKFRFYTRDAEAILRAIYRSIFRRMSRKHTSESSAKKNQRASNENTPDHATNTDTSDRHETLDHKDENDNASVTSESRRRLPDPPSLYISSADESLPGDDDSIFDFDSQSNQSVNDVPKIVMNDGSETLFSPTVRCAQMCDPMDLSGLTRKFVQTPRSARTSVSSTFTVDSDSPESDDSGEKTPHINPYAISCLFVEQNRERSTSRDTIIADTSPETLAIMREKSRSGTLTKDDADNLGASRGHSVHVPTVSAYLGVESGPEHLRARSSYRNNGLRSSVSAQDLSCTDFAQYVEEGAAATAPLPRKLLRNDRNVDYQSDDDSGSDYYDTIDSESEDDAFHDAGIGSAPVNKKLTLRRQQALRRQSSEFSDQYENIYDFLSNCRRQSQASFGHCSPDAVKHTTSVPPPLPPRPPTLLLQYSSQDSLFTNDSENPSCDRDSSELTRSSGDCSAKPNRFSQILTTQKWRRRVIRSQRRKTPSSEEDHDVEDVIHARQRTCQTETGDKTCQMNTDARQTSTPEAKSCPLDVKTSGSTGPNSSPVLPSVDIKTENSNTTVGTYQRVTDALSQNKQHGDKIHNDEMFVGASEDSEKTGTAVGENDKNEIRDDGRKLTNQKSTPNPFDLDHLLPLHTQVSRRRSHSDSCASPKDTSFFRQNQCKSCYFLEDGAGEITSTYKLITHVVKENWADTVDGDVEEEYVTHDALTQQAPDAEKLDTPESEIIEYIDDDEIYISMDTSSVTESDGWTSSTESEKIYMCMAHGSLSSEASFNDCSDSPTNVTQDTKTQADLEDSSEEQSKCARISSTSPKSDKGNSLCLCEKSNVIDYTRSRIPSVEVTSL